MASDQGCRFRILSFDSWVDAKSRLTTEALNDRHSYGIGWLINGGKAAEM